MRFNHRWIRFLFLLAFLLISSFPLHSSGFPPDDFDVFPPERTVQTASAKPSVTVRTQKPGEKVYLNGNFQGRSPIKIRNLVPGFYWLRAGGGGEVCIEIRAFSDAEYFF